MPRRTKTYVIADENRDKGKMFLLTEMPALQAEKWAIRAFLALAKAGLVIPDDVASRGMEAMAVAGFNALAGMHYEDAEPLLNEMFECVRIVRDHAHPETAFPLLPDDIEEVQTILELRREVFTLHTGFLQAVVKSKLTETSGTTAPHSQHARTSHAQSTR